jgi:nicotinamidase-related amidase
MTLFTHRAPEVKLDKERTALVLVDIQNDFLTEGGKYYVLIEELMKRNNVNANLETLLQASKDNNYPVFMSPHYFPMTTRVKRR